MVSEFQPTCAAWKPRLHNSLPLDQNIATYEHFCLRRTNFKDFAKTRENKEKREDKMQKWIPTENWQLWKKCLSSYNYDPDCLVQPRIPGLTLNRVEKEQVVFLGDGPGIPKMSFALVQPQTCTSATLGLL